MQISLLKPKGVNVPRNRSMYRDVPRSHEAGSEQREKLRPRWCREMIKPGVHPEMESEGKRLT